MRLPIRVDGDEGLGAGDRVGRSPQRLEQLETALGGRGAQLLQPDGLAAGPLLVRVLLPGAAAPQREGVVERLELSLRGAAGEPGQMGLEPADVELILGQSQPVAG